MSAPTLRELREAFATTLAERRLEVEDEDGRRGISVSALAKRARLPLLRVNAYEAGTLTPDLQDLYALADGLGIHVAELLPVFERDAADAREAEREGYERDGDPNEDDESESDVDPGEFVLGAGGDEEE